MWDLLILLLNVRMSKWSRVSRTESELSRGSRHSVEDWIIGDAKKLKNRNSENSGFKIFFPKDRRDQRLANEVALRIRTTFRTTRLAPNRVYLWTSMSFCPTWGVFTQGNSVK